MHRLPTLVVALTLIAGPARAACEPAPVATLPLISLERPVIRAQIDGVAVIMLVDTGAQETIVTPETAARIGLRKDPDHTSHLETLSGGHAVPNALVDKLAFPGVSLTHLSLPEVPLRGRAAGQDGVVGDDILHAFDLDIDIAHQKLTLYRPGSCSPVHPPWNATQSWPITISARQQITFPVVLDGHPLTALFDTGAFRGTLSRAAALRAGVTAAALQHDFARNIEGPLGYRFSRHHFNSFAFGGQSFPGPWLDVVDFDQPGVDMLVGIDYMMHRHFFISYAAGTMFMQREPDS